MDLEKLTYNVQEAAKVLGISRAKAYELVHAQDFPAIFIGRRVVIPIDALKQWLEEKTNSKV